MSKKLFISVLVLLSAGIQMISGENYSSLRDSMEAVMGPLPDFANRKYFILIQDMISRWKSERQSVN